MAVLVASGGAGHVRRPTTNPTASRASAELANVELVSPVV